MNEELEKKIDEKLLVILNLIRTNNTADDVLKIGQGFLNVANAKGLLQGKTTTRKQGAGA